MARDRVLFLRSLDRRRIALGLTMKDLARFCGFNRVTVRGWFVDLYLPCLSKLEKMLKVIKACERGELEYTPNYPRVQSMFKREYSERVSRERLAGLYRDHKSHPGSIVKAAAMLGMKYGTYYNKVRGNDPMYEEDYRAARKALQAIIDSNAGELS